MHKEKAIQLLQFIDEIQKVNGFSPNHIKCLACIYYQKGIRPSDLSENLNIDISTISRVLQSLETDLNLIEIRQSSFSKREKNVYLTAQGQLSIKRILSYVA